MATNLLQSINQDMLSVLNRPVYGETLVIPLFPERKLIQTPDNSIGMGTVVNASTAPVLFNGIPLECYHEDQVPGYNPIVPNTGGRRKRKEQ